MRAVPLAVVLSAALAAACPAAAAETPERGVIVSGEATIAVAPDLASIGAGVTSRGKTAREASEATNKAMERLLGALREAGIPERDIQTDYLSLQPLHEDSRNSGTRIVGFQASNTVRIKVRDIAKLSPVLDRIIAAGANEIAGINFSVSDQSKRLDQARAEAVEDAKRKAEVLAKAAGVGLGRAVRIVDEVRSSPGPIMMRAAAPAPPTPISPGEQTLHAAVTVTFELLH